MTAQTTDDPPGEPISLAPDEALEAVLETNDVVLVDFYASWCGPCKMMEPTIESVANSTDVTVVTVDVDAHQELAVTYGVRGVPTVALFVDGDEVKRMVGMQSEEQLQSVIDRFYN